MINKINPINSSIFSEKDVINESEEYFDIKTAPRYQHIYNMMDAYFHLIQKESKIIRFLPKQ